MIPFVDLRAQYETIRPEIDASIRRVLESSAFVGGPEVENFEKAFAAFCGATHCIALNSGTAALHFLLRANGIGHGDEVITVANSFFASAEAISQAGATPVLVDCREEDALLDPSLLEHAITPKTKAIIPVHLYGQPADMNAIRTIADKHGLFVFEDACQAHGATYQGKLAGSLAHGAAFSFYPGKNLGAYGDGGAITTDDDAVAERIRMLRDHGSKKKYEHEIVGWNDRLDGLQAAVLLAKLPFLASWNERRRAIAERYRASLPSWTVPFAAHADRASAMHLFVIRVKDRDAVKAALAERGVGTGIHYPVPIHEQPAYAGRWKHGDFPVAERLSREILSLPLYPELTNEQVDQVTAALGTLN